MTRFSFPTMLRLPRSLRTLRPANTWIRQLQYDSYNAQVAGLSEELSELRQSVHDFAQRELAPRAQQIDKSNDFPMVGSTHVGYVEKVWRNGTLGHYSS
jgi:alkylation response protein AidB-like acyl-CoA dehydrogenase